MQDASSPEVASAGFWPGTGLGEAAFYAYAYPEPAGYNSRKMQPDAAYYSGDLEGNSSCVLCRRAQRRQP